MLNILIVADNNMFIRTIYNFFANDENIIIKAVFNSNDIFNGYLKYKPEIIILDNELLIPISSIVDHFNSYHWPCSFLVVKKATNNLLHFPELCYVEPTKTSIYSGIQNHIDNIAKNNTNNNFRNLSSSIFMGHYNMMVSFNTIHSKCVVDPYTLSQFKKEASLLGDYEIYNFDGCNFLILINKNIMQVSFMQIHNLVCKFFDENYASVYEENIYHSRLFNVCKTLTDYQSLSYFLSSQCISVDEIIDIKRNHNHTDIYQAFIIVIEQIFEHDYKTLESEVHNLYLTKIKSSLYQEDLYEFHNWLHFFNTTLFKTFQLPPLEFIENRLYIEAELEKVQSYFYDLNQFLTKNQLSNLAKKCALLIIRSYSNPDFSLNDLEMALGFSKPYISRTFSQCFGITIIEFMQKIRIEIARNLLESSDISINRIAGTVGFNDAQYLSKLFKKQIGIYPTAYREISKKEKPHASICQKFRS